GDLVHADADEVIEHDLSDGAHADKSRTGSRADDGLFGDRRGTNAFPAPFRLQTKRRLEHAPDRIADILAESEHPRIEREGHIVRVPNGLGHVELLRLL